MSDNDLVKRLAWSGLLAGTGALASIVTTRIAAVIFRRLFGEDPDRQVREDLRKFKQLMETGEITTSARRREDSAYVGSTPQP